MRINKLVKKIGRSRSTIEKRIKSLSPEEVDSIRTIVNNGKAHYYDYNDTALTMLQNVKSVQNVEKLQNVEILQNVERVQSVKNDSSISKVEHLQLLLDNANQKITELKEEVEYHKYRVSQIEENRQKAETKHSESKERIQILLENQQKITMDLQQNLKLIEPPKKKGWFRR